MWDSFVVTSPAVNVSGAVVVSVSGNNQQFIDDVTLHKRDTENTFEYYQLFRVESLKPEYLSNTGNSPLRIKAMQFDQWRYDNGTKKDVQLMCRFVEGSTVVGGLEMNMTKLTDNEQICIAPKTDYVGDARLELSANGQ